MRTCQSAVVILVAVLVARVGAQPPARTRVVASGLASPVAFVQDPSNAAVQFVVEQGGRIRVVNDEVLGAADFLDLRGAIPSGGERGLLGLAFAPDYATSRRFYVNFTNPAGNTVVARFKRSTADPLVADPSTRFDLRWGTSPSASRFIAQPFANHNGGNLAFGPDGYLYIGMGDGGSADDPQSRAQNPAEFLGKMLRIDVNVADTDAMGYAVPPSNPFVSSGPAGTLPEIWSFGMRNPWRFSFDSPARGGTGALIIGDVGQGAWEEIDYEPAGRGGRNYGWRIREGAHDHVTSPAAAFAPLTDPIHEVPITPSASRSPAEWSTAVLRCGAGVPGTLLFCRLRPGPRVVDRLDDRSRHRQCGRVSPRRPYVRSRRLVGGRQHQRVRGRRGRRDCTSSITPAGPS